MRVSLPSFRKVITFIFFGLLFCRGLFELVFPKSIAMILQLSGLLLLLFYLTIDTQNWFLKRKQVSVLIFRFLFLGIVFFSAWYTSVYSYYHLWLFYVGFTVLLVIVMATFDQITNASKTPIPLQSYLLFWGFILFIFCLGQQVGLFKLPGSTEYVYYGFRSGSLTGSFLHYPLIMVMLGFILFQWYDLTKIRCYFFAGILFMISPLFVVSRSGLLIFASVWTLYLADNFVQKCRSQLSNEKRSIRKSVLSRNFLKILILGLSFSLLFCLLSIDDPMGLIIRMTHLTDTNAVGNGNRLTSWKRALDLWNESNRLIGAHTGFVTNATSNMISNQSIVAESGMLQQLVNFGLLGFLFFYGMLFNLYFQIPSDFRYLRYLIIACILQSAVYQSIEVVPFIFLLFALPWISKNFELSLKRIPSHEHHECIPKGLISKC